MSAVAQQDIFLSLSVRKILPMELPDATIESVVDAAKAAQIHDFRKSTRGYNIWVGRTGCYTVLAPEKQRIVIARQFASRPGVSWYWI